MKINVLVFATAVVCAIPALALTFAPGETLAAIGAPPAAEWLARLLGAALLGLATVNWLQRYSPTGGILGRPLLLANLMFSTVAFFATLDVLKQERTGPLVAAATVSGALAVLFGLRLLARQRPARSVSS